MYIECTPTCEQDPQARCLAEGWVARVALYQCAQEVQGGGEDEAPSPAEGVGHLEHHNAADHGPQYPEGSDYALQTGAVVDCGGPGHAGQSAVLQLHQHRARGSDVIPKQQAAQRREDKDQKCTKGVIARFRRSAAPVNRT